MTRDVKKWMKSRMTNDNNNIDCEMNGHTYIHGDSICAICNEPCQHEYPPSNDPFRTRCKRCGEKFMPSIS